MNKVLEGMARASVDADGCDGDYDKNPHEIREALATDMKRALLWLAENESEALATHICCTLYDIPHGHAVPSPMLDGMTDALIAALRAAAGSATPEVK